MSVRRVLTVRGIVQGVGFRPFVLRQATALALAGTVANTPYGVRIACEGSPEACDALAQRIRHDAPPGSVIFSIESFDEPATGESGFRILPSVAGAAQAAVSPDLGVCDACARELLDPADRRYRYPFLNCTACGPRFSILRRVPYDRANTGMAAFAMCERCAAEYADPADRRFHAQPTACADCGPRLHWLENGREPTGDPIARFVQAIRDGRIVGVRGLGGYHLACDATNEVAVRRLRENKRRYQKPLAVMARDLPEAERLCMVSDAARALLRSPRKPIVLLPTRDANGIAPSVAPGQKRLGLMLPYTPLHILLTRELPPLVLTSANVSDAPMPYDRADEPQVAALCDALLTHDRPILRRVDDSVCMLADDRARVLRRARGYAPEPLPLPSQASVLALGGQLKNAFCLLKDGRAYLSAHIGDLDDAATYRFYQRELDAFLALFDGHPDALACDLHPDYASTRMADALAERFPQAKRIAVQHHQAHFAAALAEHGAASALGFVWDGAGYGADGTLWGGELLLGGVAHAERVGRLRPLRLPGGDAAAREPWRTALAAVDEACGAETALRLFPNEPEARLMLRVAASAALSPRSSGMGRLFDCVSALAGLCARAAYEGQAAAALEQAIDDAATGAYAFTIVRSDPTVLEWDWRPVVRAVVGDALRGIGASVIAARFHRALVALIRDTARLYPGAPVALGGGVFGNAWLLERTLQALRGDGREAFANERVPSGDGGLCYGQAAVAAALAEEE